jgi:D-sedoheptulose 7-phosphate isomerase
MINKETIENHLSEHLGVINLIDNSYIDKIYYCAELIVKTLQGGGTIFWCGNGGSASDSQHLAAELIGRYNKNRKPIRSISLSSDAAVMTCISNDFGYDDLFARQLEGLGKKGDILIAITTSGNSQNILNAINQAKKMQIHSIGLLGKGGGEAKLICDNAIIVPSQTTARVQEMHILFGHIFCDLIEEGLGLK